MSSVQLLDKTRKINKLLYNNHHSKVVFNDICRVLGEVVESNAVVISRKGKVLGLGNGAKVESIHELLSEQVGSLVDPTFNERILNVLSTKENVNLETLGFTRSSANQYQAIVAPVIISGERLGTLFLYKMESNYSIDDIILCEYATTVVGLEMIRSVREEHANENRKVQMIHSALDTLSYSEKKAVLSIFDELHEMEGMLVVSKVADKAGITRSVIVNALHKLESAGIIEARSSGMKGTYIKVLNDMVYEELPKISHLR